MMRTLIKQQAARDAAVALPGRLRALHARRYACDVWETWTAVEPTITADGNRTVKNTYVGCRDHRVAVLPVR
jgi:hypothetical protein